MTVGIGLVVFLVSMGFGLQRLVRGQIANVEALTILDVSKGESTLLELNEEVVEQFNTMEDVDSVSPSLSLSAQVVHGDAVTDVAIYGINPTFLSMEGIKLKEGQEFSSEKANEMVITSTALNLVGYGNPDEAVGQELKVRLLVPQKIEGSSEEELVSREVSVKIIGTLEDEDELSISYIPIAYLQNLGYSADYSAAKVKVQDDKLEDYTLARVKVNDEAALPEVRKRIESMGYQVDSVADTVGQIDQIFVVFELIVAGFGAIALFVAALGALNTLTVSLLERTREIGLMKSLGATSGDIYKLFLVEAIIIGMTGGIIGIFVGVGGGELTNFGINYLAGRLGGEPVDMFYSPMIFLVIILLVVFFVSVITGVYPARRAAKISALDALRYE